MIRTRDEYHAVVNLGPAVNREEVEKGIGDIAEAIGYEEVVKRNRGEQDMLHPKEEYLHIVLIPAHVRKKQGIVPDVNPISLGDVD